MCSTRWYGCLALCLILSCQRKAAAQDSYYYYDRDGRGAHAFYNPQNFVVQGGLGALYDHPIDDFDWLAGFRTLNRSLGHAAVGVEDYGVKRFFWREFTPHVGAGQNYVPNWVWHFFGGGMRTKLLEEYYVDRGINRPGAIALSWLTMYASHYLNEGVEAALFQHTNRRTTDPVADLFFFDWMGKLFFQIPAVNRFMSLRLHMREWSYQAQLEVSSLRLMNNGQLYWLRREIYGLFSLSFLTGEQISSLNLTFAMRGGRQISVGVGPKSKAFIARKNGDTDPDNIVFSTGIYYSVNDNPFVVFSYDPRGRGTGGHQHRDDPYGRCLLNIYPGLLDLFGTPMGMSLAYHQRGVFLGVSFGPAPVGLSAPVPRPAQLVNGAVALARSTQLEPR